MLSRRTLLVGAAALTVPACTAQRVQAPASLVLATGPEGAVFREIGAALVKALSEQLPGCRVTARPTGASVENLTLLHRGEAQLALSSLDPIVDDIRGISAVGRLYDSFMQVVVPAGSSVRGVRDLAGLRVSVGPLGSGTEFTALRMLKLLDVQVDAQRMAHTEAAQRLAAGSLDAFLTLTGIPTPAITSVLGKVRLLELPEEAKALTERYPGPYVPATIPATTYGDLPPNKTFAVPNLLLALDSLSADVVEVVTRTVYTESTRIADGHPEASRINVRTGISTGQVPLHPGAARWFRSVKR
ncbi:TAXI family TRAP transporter solute-binding subunit [Lentzea tibetensis]|uniref:TAXI family TRAP transporter solute-binding subunit n=1 Tax=Lentzea tibetensis TaxID=2591470 RepID=A0A563ERU9_9PSEU|nr:TAXI family TRAP transporter solute-binding subunit [Lentzea tibetensis]